MFLERWELEFEQFWYFLLTKECLEGCRTDLAWFYGEIWSARSSGDELLKYTRTGKEEHHNWVFFSQSKMLSILFTIFCQKYISPKRLTLRLHDMLWYLSLFFIFFIINETRIYYGMSSLLVIVIFLFIIK